MSSRLCCFATACLVAAASAPAVVFESRCTSEEDWDFLDYTGDAKVYPTTDYTCPPGYGPAVLHVEGGVVLGLAKGATFEKGTLVALYRENDPRDADADGVIMVRAQYGRDVSAEHNVKTKRPHLWLEQDNDTGFQFRVIDAQDREFSPAERAGYGVVTDPWNESRWIWQKVRVDGARIRAKYWPAQEPEPEAWALETEYAEAGERFGLRINSGDIHVAYFAADAEDIDVAAPTAYLLFPLPRATQTRRLPLVLFTHSATAVEPAFTLVVHDSGGQLCARQQFKAPAPQGMGRLDIALLAEGQGPLVPDARAVHWARTPAPGLCTVSVTSDDGAFDAERSFEIVPAGEVQKNLDALATQVQRLHEAVAGAPPSPRTAALQVIDDAARAHLGHARTQFDAGNVGAAELSVRFAQEALAELTGYKGAWLRDIAPDLAIGVDYDPADDRRGISDVPDTGPVDCYSAGYAIRFGTPFLEAQSFVMGRSYEVVIPWTVEGAAPDRDFGFRVALVSPLGNRTPAASATPPATPTSQWQPGETYEQRVTLEITPEDPGGELTRHEPVVVDETHRILVQLTDAKTGARLLLGNPPGPQPDRPGTSFHVADVFVSSAPLEIRGFAPQDSTVGESRQDAITVRNAGSEVWEGAALFTATTETERIVFQQAVAMTVKAEGEAPVEIPWTPDTAGDLTFCVRLMRGPVTVTEASRRVAIEPPAGYDIEVVRSNHVERHGELFVAPLTVQTGVPKPFFYEVRNDGAKQASGSDAGPRATIPAAPHFGYYDVLLSFIKPLGVHFRYDRRLVATVVETDGPDLLVNGEPFLVKGTNVHGMDGGSPERTAAMMRVMRDLGFNAWRGDYPARWQVELAHELNTVYTVLAPFSCTSTAEIFARQDGPPMATAREITRLFVERYRDSAGVLLWNSCNEVGGECVDFLLSMYPVYKAHDPCSRPVHYANLYGQDYWQGQDLIGTNVYFSRATGAASRQPIIERSLAIAREAGRPLIYCEFNSWAGPIQTTGADAFRGLYAWGVEQGMAGGFHYMKGNSDRHPGIFDAGYNTHKVHNDAIIEALADAEATLLAVEGNRMRLRIRNKRRFTLRQMRLELDVSGVPCPPVEVPEDLPPEQSTDVEVPLPRNPHSPTLLIQGDLRFITHHGLHGRVPLTLLAAP